MVFYTLLKLQLLVFRMRMFQMRVDYNGTIFGGNTLKPV